MAEPVADSAALDDSFASPSLYAHCGDAECHLYPYYGVAPHECFYKRGPGFTIGQSRMLAREEWPANFVLDVDDGQDPATVTYPDACGVYYCPKCFSGRPLSDGASSRPLAEGDAVSGAAGDRRAKPITTPDATDGETP